VINPMEVGPMSEDYKGPTWDHWAELTARVEALEAAQPKAISQEELTKLLAQPAPIVPMTSASPAGSLVERVQAAIGHSYPDDARAAIREVAAWLRNQRSYVDSNTGLAQTLEREITQPTSQED
jgi:hypothetical protein